MKQTVEARSTVEELVEQHCEHEALGEEQALRVVELVVAWVGIRAESFGEQAFAWEMKTVEQERTQASVGTVGCLGFGFDKLSWLPISLLLTEASVLVKLVLLAFQFPDHFI